GSALGGLRWLRVAQREHYLAPAATRFAWRWWAGIGFNRLLGALGCLAVLVSLSRPAVAVVTAAVVAAGPVGLSLRGRTAKLAWTRRLRTLAAVSAGLVLIALAGSAVLGVEVGGFPGGGAALAGLVALGTPVLVDVACALTAPLERRLGARFVASAAARLERVRPTVVAITGSYGKTSTKGYVAHLLETTRSVVASPASFNNRPGLARTVNEHLAQGTEVFVAEMGTYRKGEIAALCTWIRPTVSVITAIGPVHLERFGSEDRIVEAKSEILEKASTIVLNVDDSRLAAIADRVRAEGRRVWRCSARDPKADVYVGPAEGDQARGESPEGAGETRVVVGGRCLGGFGGVAGGGGAAATNVACAVAVALELGASAGEVAHRLATLPVARNRLARFEAAGGFTIFDDTYNANPAGARLALAALARESADGHRRVLVTPGMVELGSRQAAENEALGALAREVVSDLVVVGHTNRRALLSGVGANPKATPVGTGSARRLVDLAAAGDGETAPDPAAAAGSPEVLVVQNRDQAVAWVREHLGPGDSVLYENDLPDHFP
ncbi:MAG TPA: UDP-N-acetylmuramoyl-tripeptide--D-alanyl-D-alanine ligase, partial [Acidimicrobiales bacterium]|nr:UDP-N-acetylmuramoyl-tripeptide--D-alanyl-D-alanine ligase [Acidimicrobiales bacterium]